MLDRYKIFLGGTCSDSAWRDELTKDLDDAEIDYFDPMTQIWDSHARAIENIEKIACRVHVYNITPKMKGFYSIAEVVDRSNKYPKDTILSIQYLDGNKTFENHDLETLLMVCEMVARNGAVVFIDDFDGMVDYIKDMYMERISTTL